MTIRAPFQPHRGTNQIVTPAAVSASVNVNPVDKTVRLVNDGVNLCHVRIGPGAQVATTADFAISGKSEEYLQKGDGDDTVAFICSAGTTLHIQTGEGGY